MPYIPVIRRKKERRFASRRTEQERRGAWWEEGVRHRLLPGPGRGRGQQIGDVQCVHQEGPQILDAMSRQTPNERVHRGYRLRAHPIAFLSHRFLDPLGVLFYPFLFVMPDRYSSGIRAVDRVPDLRFRQRLAGVIGEVQSTLVDAMPGVALEGLAEHAAQGRAALVVFAPLGVELRFGDLMVIEYKPRTGMKGNAEIL